MAAPKLTVIPGALTNVRQPKEEQARDEIAWRWRMGGLGPPRSSRQPIETADVIPILDGWIRRLERETGQDPAAKAR